MSILSDIARGLSINPAEAYVSGQRAAQQQRAGELANVLRGQQIQRNALQVAQAQAARQELAQLGQALAQRAPEIMGDDPRLPAVQSALSQGTPEAFAPAYEVLLEVGRKKSKIISGAEAEAMGFFPGAIAEETPAGDIQMLQSGIRPPTPAQQAAEARAARQATIAERRLELAESAETRAQEAAENKLVPEGVADSRAFLLRMETTGQIINSFEDDPEFNPANWVAKAGQKVPLIAPWLTSEKRKKYDQAAQNWIRANLRKESGAVIGDQEMQDEYETYFPTAGNGPEVVQQKRQARALAEQAMRVRAQLRQQAGIEDPPPPPGAIEDPPDSTGN